MTTSSTPSPARGASVTSPVIDMTRSRRPRSAETRVTALVPGGGATEQDSGVPVADVQGTLALDLRGSVGMPATPELRLVRPRVPESQVVDDVQGWAARFAQAVVEVLGGDRPHTQLVRWTSAPVYEDLVRRVRILARTSAAPQRRRTVRPQVRSVHVFQPTRGTAEVSVHVRHGQRSRAIAARLELRRGRWQCTVLQLG